MASSGKNRGARLFVLLCGALAVVSLSLTAPVADAAPLAEVTGVVGGPVEEVTQTVVPPVEEVTEAVAAPVQQAAEPTAKPVVEAAATATRPVQEATGPVTEPVHETVAAAESAPPIPTREAAATALRPVSEAAGGASRQVARTAAPVAAAATHAVAPLASEATAPSASASAPVRAPSGSAAQRDVTGVDAGSPPAAATGSPATVSAPVGRSGNTFEAPSTAGAVRAPPPPWLAYVWPAVALTGRDVADFLDRWGKDGLRPALIAYETGAGAGHRPVVAGVHASGGERSSGSSPSPLEGLTRAVGSVTSNVPGEALAYLLLVALFVLGVFAVYRIESARNRRQGSG